MKKAELEVKLLELEKKIVVLETRPVCYGHCCPCNNHNPYQPFYSPAICGTTTGGLVGKNVETVTFGKINS